jgi:hypothetical protein
MSQTQNKSQTLEEYIVQYVREHEDEIIANYLRHYYSLARLEEIAETVAVIKIKGTENIRNPYNYNNYGYNIKEMKVEMAEYTDEDRDERAILELKTPSGAIATTSIILTAGVRYEKQIYEEKERLINKWKNLIEIAKQLVKCSS